MVRRQAKAARGGHRWSGVVEEEVWVVGGGFRGRDRGENGCFMMLNIFVVSRLTEEKFGLPGQVDPTQIHLSEI